MGAVFAQAGERTIDRLNDAIAICDREIADASSGNYSGYRTFTLRSVLTNIQRIIADAKAASKSNMTADLVDLTVQKINDEVSDSYRWDQYSVGTVVTLMRQVKGNLEVAKKYDPAGSCAQ